MAIISRRNYIQVPPNFPGGFKGANNKPLESQLPKFVKARSITRHYLSDRDYLSSGSGAQVYETNLIIT